MKVATPRSIESLALDVMSGRARGLGAALARAALSAVEPAYAGVASARNRLFDAGLKSARRLPCPVISVGNLTTGGTGKTPAVQWLVRLLRARGRVSGVLTRGYRRDGRSDEPSDEEQLLRESLGCPVVADADRHRGGLRLLAEHPDVDALVLDDGFQHRRLARDLDVVLIDATNPFGFGHVLPRGLLREPVAGVARAGLVIVTRVDLVAPADVARVEAEVRRHHPTMPIVRATHAPGDLTRADGTRDDRPLDGRPVFALSALGNPQAFEASLGRAGATVVGGHRHPDHHAYADADLCAAVAAAANANADLLVTTEKDWIKLRDLPAVAASTVPIVRLGVRLEIDDIERALAVIDRVSGRITPDVERVDS